MKFFSWLRWQPCVLTRKQNHVYNPNCLVERSHIRRLRYGAGGKRKPDHWFCIPLAKEKHREIEAVKGGVQTWEAKYGKQETFLIRVWKNYGLDKIPDYAKRLYEEETGEKIT